MSNTQDAAGWVPVSECAPAQGDEILITGFERDGLRFYAVAVFDSGRWMCRRNDGSMVEFLLPDYWRPIAAPGAAPAAPAGLTISQEPKYTVNGSAIINRATGEAIPADEPVFIFRARDNYAAGVLGDYAEQCTDIEHLEAVTARFIQFSEWADAHPERVKEPDTAPSLTTCSCRWDGDTQVQQCTLHEAHVDAIHEWADRAKTAEKALAAPAAQPEALAVPAALNSWFLSLPEGRRKVLRDNKWMLADAAYQAGLTARAAGAAEKDARP